MTSAISVTVSDAIQSPNLLALKQLPCLRGSPIPMQIYCAVVVDMSRGVIYELYRGETNNTLATNIVSAKSELMSTRLLGNNNSTSAVLTFLNVDLPRADVYEYRPWTVLCSSCHRPGHEADISTGTTTCARCGQGHVAPHTDFDADSKFLLTVRNLTLPQM